MKDFINQVGASIPLMVDFSLTNPQKGRIFGRFYGLYDYDLSVINKLKILFKHGA